MPVSRRRITVVIVFLVAAVALLIPVLVAERNIQAHTAGTITLPTDQDFINIAVAKNLAFYATWGLARHNFQPAASSLLYPVILVPFFFIAGKYLIIPVLLNLAAAILLLWILQRKLIRKGLAPIAQLSILLLFIFFTPLPILVLSGTEYPLFLLMLALFISSFIHKPLHYSTAIFAFLLTATRYEGFLAVTAVCGIFIYRRQLKAALKTATAGAMPILAFGAFAASKNELFFPKAFFQYPDLVLTVTFLIGCLLTIMTLATPLNYKRQWLASSLFGLVAILRTVSLTEDLTQDSVHTWRRESPVVDFVHRFYPRWGISLNETGVLSYYSDGDKVDLTGTANYSMPWRTTRKHASPAVSDSLSWWAYARIGIISGPNVRAKPIGDWKKVAEWNVSGDPVDFYALDTAIGRGIKERMEEYRPNLPANVRINYP